MSINSVGSPDRAASGLSELIKRTMSEVDTNKDGQVSSSEFGSFLKHLLEGLSPKVRNRNHDLAGTNQGSPDLASTAGSVLFASAVKTAASDGGGPYFNVPGFELSKLQDTTHVNDKYTPAVRAFSQAVAAGDLKCVTDSLTNIVEYAQSNGFPDAKVTSADCIDFGDGYGPIDTIVDVGSPNAHWWFHNNLLNG
jgi:hypothetical protein